MKLTGTRTHLRDFRLDDAPDAAAIIGDDRVTYWLSFDSRPAEAAVAMMERAVTVAAEEPRGEYYLAITELDGDQVVGFVRLELTGVKAAKLGLAVHHDHWRKGYALDAAYTLMAYGFDKLGLHRITAAVGPANSASLALVDRLGFVQEGCLRDHVFTNGAWRDSVLFSILEDEFRAAGCPVGLESARQAT